MEEARLRALKLFAIRINRSFDLRQEDVEMEEARLRALKHHQTVQLQLPAKISVEMEEARLRALKLILSVRCNREIRRGRNGRSPVEGIETFFCTINVKFVKMVEMEEARLRALKHNRNILSIFIPLRRNGRSPVEGIETFHLQYD